MKKMLIPIIIVVVLGIAAAAYFLLFSGSDEPKPPDYKYYKPGEFIITNITDSARLVKVTPILEYDENIETEAVKGEFLTLNEHIIRDTIIELVRVKTEPEMRSREIMEQLRSEILSAVRQKLGVDYITGVYFYDLVLQ